MYRYSQMPIQTVPQAIDNIVFRGRILWRDIATWIRAYLVAAALQGDLKLQEKIANRLLKISDEFGSMLRVFFGSRVSQNYKAILSEYIMALINLINAQVSGDLAAASEYKKQAYENADKGAEFLSETNPFWDNSTFKNLFYNFTSMTIQEIDAFTSGKYEESIKMFDRLLNQSTVMGDYLAQGIGNYLTYSMPQS